MRIVGSSNLSLEQSALLNFTGQGFPSNVVVDLTNLNRNVVSFENKPYLKFTLISAHNNKAIAPIETIRNFLATNLGRPNHPWSFAEVYMWDETKKDYAVNYMLLDLRQLAGTWKDIPPNLKIAQTSTTNPANLEAYLQEVVTLNAEWFVFYGYIVNNDPTSTSSSSFFSRENTRENFYPFEYPRKKAKIDNFASTNQNTLLPSREYRRRWTNIKAPSDPLIYENGPPIFPLAIHSSVLFSNNTRTAAGNEKDDEAQRREVQAGNSTDEYWVFQRGAIVNLNSFSYESGFPGFIETGKTTAFYNFQGEHCLELIGENSYLQWTAGLIGLPNKILIAFDRNEQAFQDAKERIYADFKKIFPKTNGGSEMPNIYFFENAFMSVTDIASTFVYKGKDPLTSTRDVTFYFVPRLDLFDTNIMNDIRIECPQSAKANPPQTVNGFPILYLPEFFPLKQSKFQKSYEASFPNNPVTLSELWRTFDPREQITMTILELNISNDKSFNFWEVPNTEKKIEINFLTRLGDPFPFDPDSITYIDLQLEL